MGAINTSAQLANIRSQMDAQQQVVSMLENELQKSILGGSNKSLSTLLDVTGGAGSIGKLYSDAGLGDIATGGTKTKDWIDAMRSAVAGKVSDTTPADQDALRQLLYQARALLGELRIEEQAWNGEVNSEKSLRKEVNDFAKV